MDEVARIARENKPKLIIAGGTAYSRIWDWARFREIADEVGAYSAGRHVAYLGPGRWRRAPLALPHAHVVTTTTHKSLRGPRSGMILSNDEALAKKINSAVFPGFRADR
jgi:glycine hydroxymethyltransferase